MATDVNEIYEKYPCAKEAAENNIKFWGSEESLEEVKNPQYIDAAMKVHGGEEELYNFFQQLIHYDAFLLKENEITLEEEMTRNYIIEKLTQTHLGYWHDALYSSPKIDDFLDDQSYWKIFSEDNL